MIRTLTKWLPPALLVLGLITLANCDRYQGDLPNGLPDLADGVLGAGFGRADITPEIQERFTDLDEDGIFDGEVTFPDGNTEVGLEPFADNNDNGYFDALWLALRYGEGGRPAHGVRDELSVAAAIFKTNGFTVALAVLDLPGLQRHEIEKIRQQLGPAYGIDRLAIVATGNRQGPDTVGTAYPYPEAPSYNEEYIAFIGDAVLAAIDEAAADFGPVQMELAQFDTSPLGLIDGGSTAWGLCADTRDPQAFDPTFTVAAFYPLSISEPQAEQPQQTEGPQISGPTVGVTAPDTTAADIDTAPVDGLPEARGSLLFWGCSPTSLPNSEYVSADFPGRLRNEIDFRLGGKSIFLPVATGGQSPSPVPLADMRDDNFIIGSNGIPQQAQDNSFTRFDSIAKSIAQATIEALKNTEIALNISVDFSYLSFPIPVDAERFYHAAQSAGRPLFDAAGNDYSTGRVFIESEAALLTIGPLGLLLLPGDPLPEFGSDIITDFETYRSSYFISDDQQHVAPYPAPPLLAGPGTLAISNAGDALGLLAPAADYAASATAPGHYGEASSPGPETLAWLLDGLYRMGIYPVR